MCLTKRPKSRGQSISIFHNLNRKTYTCQLLAYRMPETQMEGVSRTLTNLRKLEDVLDAFIVTMSGNRYTAPGIPSKIENIGLLTLLYSTMNSFMGLLNRLYAYKADYIVVKLQDMLILI